MWSRASRGRARRHLLKSGQLREIAIKLADGFAHDEAFWQDLAGLPHQSHFKKFKCNRRITPSPISPPPMSFWGKYSFHSFGHCYLYPATVLHSRPSSTGICRQPRVHMTAMHNSAQLNTPGILDLEKISLQQRCNSLLMSRENKNLELFVHLLV